MLLMSVSGTCLETSHKTSTKEHINVAEKCCSVKHLAKTFLGISGQLAWIIYRNFTNNNCHVRTCIIHVSLYWDYVQYMNAVCSVFTHLCVYFSMPVFIYCIHSLYNVIGGLDIVQSQHVYHFCFESYQQHHGQLIWFPSPRFLLQFSFLNKSGLQRSIMFEWENTISRLFFCSLLLFLLFIILFNMLKTENEKKVIFCFIVRWISRCLCCWMFGHKQWQNCFVS